MVNIGCRLARKHVIKAEIRAWGDDSACKMVMISGCVKYVDGSAFSARIISKLSSEISKNCEAVIGQVSFSFKTAKSRESGKCVSRKICLNENFF